MENDSFTITKANYFATEKQILAQQQVIEKMREAFNKIKNEANNPDELVNHDCIYHWSKEAISLQPSTAELEAHDEAVRVEEREKCLKIENLAEDLRQAVEAIRQRKTS